MNLPTGLAKEFAEEMMNLCKKYEVEADGLKTLLPVTERIKTFEDAIEALGQGNPLVEEYIAVRDKLHTDTGDLIAYLKLRIITAALNDGWGPEFRINEFRWYPWFEFYTKEEIDIMDEEQKGRVLGRSIYSANAHAGVAYSFSNSASSYSYTGGGARLCFKERALVVYAGRQFLKEWADFMGFTK